MEVFRAVATRGSPGHGKRVPIDIDMRPVRQAVTTGDLITDKLGSQCTLLAGVNVRASLQYRRWRSATFIPRNQIVQSGRSNVTTRQAEAAIKAAAAFITYIDSVL